MASERFLTLADVADILNISASQTYALVKSGELKGIQIGGRKQWRVERTKLEEYIAHAYESTAANLNDLPTTLPVDASH
jgi:excisionase family DNA binding protein